MKHKLYNCQKEETTATNGPHIIKTQKTEDWKAQTASNNWSELVYIEMINTSYSTGGTCNVTHVEGRDCDYDKRNKSLLIYNTGIK